jgi:hypothetical protein
MVLFLKKDNFIDRIIFIIARQRRIKVYYVSEKGQPLGG